MTGKLNNVTALSNRFLLLKWHNEEQSKTLQTLKTLNNIPITITPYNTLNFTRGVITCKELHMCTNKEITSELFHQAVINCLHIIKRNKQAVPTHVLTFNRLQLAIINSVGYQFV